MVECREHLRQHDDGAECHVRNEHAQAEPFGHGSGARQHHMRVEHVVPGATHLWDLDEMVHHGDPGEARALCSSEDAIELIGRLEPVEPGDVEMELQSVHRRRRHGPARAVDVCRDNDTNVPAAFLPDHLPFQSGPRAEKALERPVIRLGHRVTVLQRVN